MTRDQELAGVDTDAHVAPPQVAALLPHLTEHWGAYLRESGFGGSPASATTYPPGSPVAGDAPARTTLDELREHVLSRSASAILTCAYGVEGIRHPYMSAALAGAVNSWIAAEWLDREPRFAGSIVVASHATALAVEEIKRVGKDRRFVQILLPARAGDPYGNQRYWPIYEAAVELDLTVTIHFGGVSGMPATPVGHLSSYFEEYVAGSQPFPAHLVSLIAEGVFDRYPDLRVTFAESGVSWLPTWLWRIDGEWRANRREVPWVKRLPTEYARRHLRLTLEPFDAFEPVDDLARSLKHLDADAMLMYSSDYPHRHGSGADRVLALLSPVGRERVLRKNAAEWYREGAGTS